MLRSLAYLIFFVAAICYAAIFVAITAMLPSHETAIAIGIVFLGGLAAYRWLRV